MVKTLHARAATSEKDFEEYEGESEPNMKFSHALIVVLLLHILAVGGVFAFNALKGRHAAPDRAKLTAAQVASASMPDVVTAPANKAAAPAREGATTLPAAPGKTSTKSQPETASATHAVVPGDTLARIATAHKTTVEAIEQANAIDGKSTLRVGQALKIPAKSNAAKPPAKPDPASAKTSEPKPMTAAKAAEAKPSMATKASEPKAAAPATKASEVKPIAAAKTAEATTAPKPAAGDVSKADTNPAPSDKTYTVAKGDNPYAIAKKLKVKYNDLIKANNIQDPTKLQIGQKLIIP